MNSLYNSLSRKYIKYNDTLVRKSIKIIRSAPNTRIADRERAKILDMMSRVIVKGVNNFFKLMSNVEQNDNVIIHTYDDIVAECYIILDKCVEKFDLENENKFYFYFNKSVNQGLFRIQERCYRTKNIDINEPKYRNFGSETIETPILLENILNDKQMLVINSKLENQDVHEFCKMMKMTSIEYNNILRQSKDILRKHLS